MPQFDSVWFVSQLFWLCVCFFGFWFIMAKIILPKIVQTMNQRQNKIETYLQQANELKEQAENSMKKYDQTMKDSSAKANKILEKTKKELAELINDKQNQLDEKLAINLKEGEAKINKAHKEMMKKVKNMSVEMSAQMLNKIGVANIKTDEIEKIVTQVMENK